MADEIKPGDVVQLKSGGPKMTVGNVTSLKGVPHAHCEWFIEAKQQHGSFPLTSLKRVD